MNADYRLIGRQISFYRKEAGLTQENLAEACDISTNYLNKIENGRKKPSLDVLVTIADTLGITMNNLLSGNQSNDLYDYYDDLTEIMIDCSPKERRVLLDIAIALKNSLRKP